MQRSCYSEWELVRLVSWQTGRKPSIEFRVIVRCEYGWPVVLNNSPFNAAGHPNPNLYYLTCPYLRLVLARLEDSGLTGKLQRKISEDPVLKGDLVRAQDNHDLEWRQAAGDKATGVQFPRMNIAGSGDTAHLKCLHAQFAYFLTHPDYRIGTIIAGVVGKIYCDDEMCRNWKS